MPVLRAKECIDSGGEGEREREREIRKPLTHNHRVRRSGFVARVSVLL